MTNTIFTEQIKKIEEAYKERLEKPLHYEAEMQELKNMLKQYCKEIDIHCQKQGV